MECPLSAVKITVWDPYKGNGYIRDTHGESNVNL